MGLSVLCPTAFEPGSIFISCVTNPALALWVWTIQALWCSTREETFTQKREIALSLWIRVGDATFLSRAEQHPGLTETYCWTYSGKNTVLTCSQVRVRKERKLAPDKLMSTSHSHSWRIFEIHSSLRISCPGRPFSLHKKHLNSQFFKDASSWSDRFVSFILKSSLMLPIQGCTMYFLFWNILGFIS